MKKRLTFFIVFLIIAAIGTGLYFWSVWATFAWFVTALAGLLIYGAYKRMNL